ncbi:GntR family transcriptional regulator [Mesorhizobium sp. Root552]|uniref:FadR/GntR family transcriptional regulator n=1 Tax=Mesorhizobium sp. Root552 TaxID=1736555 RepID=UPI0006F22812|nr:FadR/GntR family transcriptional regulator [Mesorhizobium sp. Root552]KQZ31352.1 GntR family transcriptional regulator [Mesorhizobium sp. Root552]
MSMDEPRGNSNYALEKLRELLQSGEVGADGKLPTERTLSDRLGLGRRAIRRALEVLEAEGRIWRRQGSGTYVGLRPDGWSEHLGAIVAGTDFMEIMEVRLRIEPQLAQLAALRAKAPDVERMYDLIDKTRQSTDADGHELWDGALHRQVAQCAGNTFFLAIFDVVNRVRQDPAWQTIRERARNATRSMPLSHRQHLAIVDAIAAHDPVRAGEAMRQHLLTLQESLIRLTSLDRQETEAEKELS